MAGKEGRLPARIGEKNRDYGHKVGFRLAYFNPAPVGKWFLGGSNPSSGF